jgi:hypothetical protein
MKLEELTRVAAQSELADQAHLLAELAKLMPS